MRGIARTFAVVALAGLGLASAEERLPPQQEIPPPGGTGRVVVVISGQTGPENYLPAAREVAAAGYDVVLVDGKDIWTKDAAGQGLLSGVIERARRSPHAAPGLAGVIGFSMGGGSALRFAAQLPDSVGAVVGIYPLTRFIIHPDRFVGALKVPTLLLAGVRDTYKDCCRIETARALAAAAGARGGAPSLEVVEYPDAAHGWNIRSLREYRKDDAEDSLRRAVAHLRRHLGG